jgi:nucleoside 2-deoxyribosyltransferase
MNRLKGQCIYLAGPMDRVKDRGVEWREMMKEFIWNELEGGVFNHCDKAIEWGAEDETGRRWRQQSIKDAAALHKAGYTHDSNKVYEAVYENMKDIVASDLRGVDTSHALILYVDTDVHMCGSFFEAAWACLLKKPVIVCCKQGKVGIPDWLFGVCRHEMMFGSWDEVKNYLRHVAFDPNAEHYKRWRFIDMEKVYGNTR